MKRYTLSDQDYDALVAVTWRALDGACHCKRGQPCTRTKTFSDTLASILGSVTTQGEATVEVWQVWRDFPAIFRVREPLQ